MSPLEHVDVMYFSLYVEAQLMARPAPPAGTPKARGNPVLSVEVVPTVFTTEDACWCASASLIRALKSQIGRVCDQLGTPIAGVALSPGVNANLAE